MLLAGADAAIPVMTSRKHIGRKAGRSGHRKRSTNVIVMALSQSWPSRSTKVVESTAILK